MYFTYHKIYLLSSWWKFFIYSEPCHHPYHLLTEHFTTHSPLPPAPGNYKSTFCLLICLFWTFNLESQEHVAFYVQFLSFSIKHPGSSILHHVPVLHSFLSLNNFEYPFINQWHFGLFYTFWLSWIMLIMGINIYI